MKHMRYTAPALLLCLLSSPAAAQWQAFTRMLERKGRARISVASTLLCEGQEVGHFEGEFVALGTAIGAS